MNQQGVHDVGANMNVCVFQKCTKFTMGSRCMPILPKSGLQQNLQVVNALYVCQLLDYHRLTQPNPLVLGLASRSSLLNTNSR